MEEQMKAVRNMQNYIEAHLYETITAADLARASGYSSWYANRLFSHWLNITPAEYIRKLRLSKSALKLRDEDIKIIYAKAPMALYLFTPYGILPAKKRKEHCMSETGNVFIQIIDKPARKVLVKRGIKAKHYFEYCEEVGCEIWKAEKKYDPTSIGYVWDMDNPRIQLEPKGERGYVELLPIVGMEEHLKAVGQYLTKGNE